MRVLVIGATGPTGRQIVSQALEVGHQVTALVRKPAEAALPAGAKVVQGDVMDSASMAQAASGQEAVVSSLGSKITRKPTTLFSVGTRNLIAAMKVQGVRRFVCITGIGAGDSRGHGGFLYDRIFQPLLLSTIYADKDRQEEIVRASGLAWTLVRPGALTNGAPTGAYRRITEIAGARIGKISRADVAGYVLEILSDPATFGQTVNLTY